MASLNSLSFNSHPSNNARCWTFFFAERSCVYSLNFLLRRRRIALQGATSVVVALISHNCHKKNTGKYIWLKFATRKTAGNISYHGTFYAGWCLGQVEFLFNYQWVRIKDFFLILLHWAHLIVGFLYDWDRIFYYLLPGDWTGVWLRRWGLPSLS